MSTPSGTIEATYDYRDETGELLYQAVRYAPKDFRFRRPGGNGDWIWDLKGVSRVPYRLPELMAADPSEPVLVVEGEKDAEALRALGYVATCNPGGAGKWRDAFAPHFADRHVVVVPDADEPGRNHAEQVARSLAEVAASVKVVEL